MSLMTYIDGVPVYSTIAESMSWGSQYNLSGYHEHIVSGRLGYMGGTNHQQITQAIRAKAEGVTPTPPPTPTLPPRVARVIPAARQVRQVRQVTQTSPPPPRTNNTGGY